jgi:DNA-binding IclR family transcriptional regulator
MLDHKRILYTDMIESPHGLRMAAQVGTSGPVYCTALGKAILAHQRNDEARAILAAVERRPYTANTKTGIGEVLEELEAVKTRGYAVDNEENEIGVRCVGVPILDSMGLAVAAISASGPEWRLSEDKVGHVGRALLAAAAQIEQLCGYQPETRNEALRGDSSLLDPPASLTTTVRVGRTLAKRNSLPTSATNSIATD